jgi:hypothetical protein
MQRRTVSTPPSTGTTITTTGVGLRKLVFPHDMQVRGQGALAGKRRPQKEQ